jgi:hypothetical protein
MKRTKSFIQKHRVIQMSNNHTLFIKRMTIIFERENILSIIGEGYGINAK